MGQLVAFPARQAAYLSGEARCMSCGHEWMAVTPVGTVEYLECPCCGLFRAVLEGLCEPDGPRYVCHCGCDLYYIVPDGCMCLKCGVIASGF